MSGHDVAVTQIAASGNAKLVASAGDNVISLWNGSNGQALKTLVLGSMAYTVALSPDGKRVAAGSFDGVVRVFDTAAGKPIFTLASGDAAEWLALTPEGYVNCSDGWAAIGRWQWAKQDVPATACWATLRQPAAVAKLAVGEKVPEPGLKR
jgi:WD40 repeat protein